MIEVEDKEIITLFPSFIFKGKVNDLSICDDVDRKLRTHRTLGKGVFEAKNFISSDMLQDDPEFKDLADLILREAEGILDFYSVKRDSHYISNMWGNITDPNHRHPVHIHPNCFLSGIIYIRTPAKCGATAFTDPRPGARIFEPSYHQMNETNSGLFRHPPEKGVMLFWNSWLPHGVDRGFTETKEDRIVVAFNIMLKGTINTPTAKLVL